jgi:hypothetical protein
MSDINFYTAPSRNYHNLDGEQLGLFDDLVREINKNDRVFSPHDLYDLHDENGVSLADFIYVHEQNDISMMLEQILRPQASSTETFGNLCEDFKNGEEMGFASIDAETENPLHNDITVVTAYKISCLPHIKRHYIRKCKNYGEFRQRAIYAYSDLIFHDHAFNDINRLGRIDEAIDELDRHLSVINDCGRQSYREKYDDEYAYQVLRSNNVLCSGKGSSEGEFKKIYTFEGQSYKLTCNPHTKLFAAHSDKRIYFCWGRKEIEDYKIIVAKIGGHWVGTDNSN